MVRCTRSDSRWSTEVRCAAVVVAALMGVRPAPEVVMSVRHDRTGWAATLRTMSARGAKGTDEEFRAVLGYLAAHFPAEELARINVNTATAIELESGLSLRRSQAAAIIAYRSQHGTFKSLEDLKQVPGLDSATIEAKRDRVTF